MKTSDLIGPALDWAVAKCEEPNEETDVDVINRANLDEEHQKLHPKPWLVVYPNGRTVYHDTEVEACAHQMAHRASPRGNGTNRYRVTWTILIQDDDVKTHVEAAQAALEIQRDPDSIATVFEVTDDNGDSAMVVDLADGSVVELPA